MKTTQILTTGILLASLMAIQAMAAAPIWDPSYPSKYVNERAVYYGQVPSVPEASSSGQEVTIKKTLGEGFPTTVYTPVFGGRLTGYATLSGLPKNNYVSKQQQKVRTPTNKELPKDSKDNKDLKMGYVSPTQISGKLSRFPVTKWTPKFSGRWIGPAKTAISESDK